MMTAASTADTVTFSLVGFIVVIGAIVVWRIVGRDKAVRRIRFGFFYERDLDPRHLSEEGGEVEDAWERPPELPPSPKESGNE